LASEEQLVLVASSQALYSQLVLAVVAFVVFLYSLFFSWLESDFHRMFQFTPFLKKEKHFS
jgi:uncharacterized membrane protein YdbT with pleckstrin-like domain